MKSPGQPRGTRAYISQNLGPDRNLPDIATFAAGFRHDAMLNSGNDFSYHTPMREHPLLAGLAWLLPVRSQPAIASGLVDDAASTLAALIDDARRQAIADGVRPIPPAVYRALLGYFPAALLRKCRFAATGARALTVPALAVSYGDPKAVTLSDVVLFKNQRNAETDLKDWAHELSHMMQFQRWGIEGFAEHYVRDSSAVEHEAIDNANRFATWLPRRGLPPARP